MNRKYVLLAATALLCGCSTTESLSGKGIITETTNGVSVRGQVVSADSVPLVGGSVRAVLDEDVPESWNGTSRAIASFGSDGGFLLKGLDKPRFILFAEAKNDRGQHRAGVASLTISGDSTQTMLPFVAAPASILQGRYAAYDSVAATLASGWQLRATVRGLGMWTFLDSTGGWSFDSVPAGSYHLRIQKVDGTPTHETTLMEFTQSTP
ncbi:MAG: hypothetical protein RL318_15 [Fibrobacterota bacterium]|jgi:hypothetical protein